MTRLKRFISMMAVGVLAISMLPVTVKAEEMSVYEETNAYVLNYNGDYGQYMFDYGCPYVPTMTFEHISDTPYWDWTGMGDLYNVNNPEEYVAVYCVDQYTSVVDNTYYKRVNLEDSEYFSDDAAGLLRSIMLNGFPKVGLEELAEAAGVESLTVGEAVNATQLAIWQASYGDQYKVDQFVSDIKVWWQRSPYGYGARTRYNQDCYEEVESGYASMENAGTISQNMEAVFNYLINLEPTEPQGITVSASSFIDWSEEPTLTDNGNGTYNVTVSAQVKVVENEGDALTLSAVLGGYHKTIDLQNGEQTVSLTIEDVPAAMVYDEITIAIDGKQTVADVYMFAVEAGREAAQRRIGYSNLQLPVHEEVTVKPERIINFYKTTKIEIDEEGNQTRIPLSGITFDLYLVAELEDYVTGEVTLPENIDLGTLGDPTYHYPDYTVTTDENGRASINLSKNGLPDGVYVIAERANDAIEVSIDPFYIMMPNTNADRDGWDYEVLVQPKNEVKPGPAIRKDVIEIEHEDKSGEEEQRASVAAGEPFTWIVRGDIPVDLSDAKDYVITDELDYRLTFVDEEEDETDDVVVKVEAIADDANYNASGNNVLVRDTDYILTVNTQGTVNVDANGNVVVDGSGTPKAIQTLEVELTAAGMDKVAKIAGEDYKNYEVRVYFNTVLDGDASVGEDIPNDAKLVYISSVGFRYETESDDPYVYTCGINIHKYDAKNTAKVLPGAEFKLARAATEDEIKAGLSFSVIVDGEAVQVVYEWFYDKAEMTGDKVDVAVTGEDGNAVIYGLADGEYYLIESKAPATYNLLRYPITVELNEKKNLVTENVANSNALELPETGGIGTTIFKICGAALIVVAVVVLIVKKRKENEEE